jgi:chorismate mutase
MLLFVSRTTQKNPPRRIINDRTLGTMIPSVTQSHLLLLANIVAILLAHRLTPDDVRQLLLKLTKDLKSILPPDSLREIEAAEAKATLRAMAYRRVD